MSTLRPGNSRPHGAMLSVMQGNPVYAMYDVSDAGHDISSRASAARKAARRWEGGYVPYCAVLAESVYPLPDVSGIALPLMAISLHYRREKFFYY